MCYNTRMDDSTVQHGPIDQILHGRTMQDSPPCAVNRYLVHDDWQDQPPCDQEGNYLLVVEDRELVLRFCLPHYQHIIAAIE